MVKPDRINRYYVIVNVPERDVITEKQMELAGNISGVIISPY